MGTVANLIVRVGANISDFDKQIASLEKSFDRTGAKMQSIGAKLTTSVTLPIVAIAGASIKAAMDFEDAFSGVAKTVDGVANSKGQLTAFGKELQQQFRNLAKTIPVSVNELAKIGEVAGAMGIPKEKILDFTEVMAKLGATTDLTSEDAAASIGKIQNVYQAAGVETDRFASSLVALGNAGASTESQILAFAERMGGAAVQANVTQAEVLGWANAMASVGLNAELGSTAWNKVISSIGKAVDLGGDKLHNFAVVAGMTADSFSKLFKADASEAMNRVVEGFGRIKDSGGNVTAVMEDLGMKTSGIQMTFKNLASAGDMVRQSLDLGKKAWQENVAMEEEFAKKSATTSSILKVLFNNLYDVGISLGQQLIPHFMRLLPAVQSVTNMLVGLVGWFSKLPTGVQTATIAAVGFAAALGPMLFVIGQVVSAGGALLSMFRLIGGTAVFTALTPSINGARIAASGFATALMSIPFAGTIAGVAALAAGYGFLAFKISQAVREQGLWESVKQGVSGALPTALPFLGFALNGGGGAAPRTGSAATRKDIDLPADPLTAFIHQVEQAQEFQKKAAALRPDLFGDGGLKTGPKQKTEAERAAEAWQKSLDQLSGREAISVADEWMKKVSQIGGVTKLAATDQERYNKALEDAMDAMLRLGQAVDPKTWNAWLRSLPNAVNGITGALPGQALAKPQFSAIQQMMNSVPGVVNGLTSLPGQQIAAPTPPNGPGFLGRAFGTSGQFGADLSGVIMQALTGGGNIGKSIGGFLGGSVFGELGKTISKSIGGMLGGALGSVMGPLGSLLGSLGGKLLDKVFGPTAYEQRVRADNQSRQELRSSLDMTELQRQAAFTGRQDLLTGITSGFATNNDPEYLRGLVNDLNSKTQELQAAMDRYGISWEQLGEKAKQSQINQMAEQFILDFQLLTQAGADVNFVIEKMSGSVNEFVQTAIRTGTEVPIAMQPMLQKMLEMGLLTDASGVALTDLSSIQFSESMTQGFGRVVEAINHLTRALGYDLPAAANAAADGMNAAFDRVNVPGAHGGTIVEARSGDEPEYIDVPQMASGGIVRARMGGTLVNVGEGGRDEAIVPLGGRGGGAGMTIIIERDGEREAEWIVPYLPGAARRFVMA